MDMERLGLFLGGVVVRFAAPGLRPDGRQKVEIEFDDGRIITGFGRNVGEAVINASRRKMIRLAAADAPEQHREDTTHDR